MKSLKSLSAWSLILLISQVVYSQEVINSAGPVVLPSAGGTKIVANGQSLIVSSGQSVTLLPGFYAQEGSTVSIKIITANVYPTPPSTYNINPELNWVLSRTFNAKGDPVRESKSYFDLGGQALQMQSKSFTSNYVVASQSVYDRWGRAAIQTLPAPINSSGFSYKADFMSNAFGQNYGVSNFDVEEKLNNPDPVGNSVPGTLGWYYSNNNSWEPYVAATGFPYSRTDYYKDGTEAPSRSANAGDQLRMGQGHEVGGVTFPVIQELANYMSIRNRFFGGGANGELGQNNLQGNAVINSSKDAQGNWGASITDKDGKALVTALPGNWLTVANSVQLTNYKEEFIISGGVGDYQNIRVSGFGKIKIFDQGTQIYHGDATGYAFPVTASNSHVYRVISDKPFQVKYDVNQGGILDPVCESCASKIAAGSVEGQDFHYFSLPQGGNISVSGGSISLLNLTSNLAENNLNALPPGLYRARATAGEPQLTYSVSYGDISYNFYDQKGQLLAEIAPSGVQQLLTNGINAYASKEQLPFTIHNEYDRQGRLIAKIETDAGRTEYVYRKDGRIRFSQNAEQRKANKFSYTNYDGVGRPIESGEIWPGTIIPAPFEIAKSNSEIAENPLFDSRLGGLSKSQTVNTFYDLPDNSHGLTNYIQEFLDGRISYTTNGTSTTWYSYDEQGRIVWVVKSLIRFGTKTIDYTYDFQGNVISVAYQKGAAGDSFYHYYEYDADQRLLNVKTSKDGINLLQQARYTYYLHGPVKRVELADNLQGIDYTYTVQGLLKTINHPLSTTDPGHDGQNSFAPDAFGMTMEYFSGDYVRNNSGISSITDGNSIQNFTGNISAQSWRSQKPVAVTSIYGVAVNDPAMFTYQYNNKYQFTGNKYGTPNFAGSTFNELPNINKEFNLAYDPNGNIQTLNRTDQNGTIKPGFSGSNYHYQTGSNKLTTVDNYASYNYDELGQMTAQSRVNGNGYYPTYNIYGQISAIYSDANHYQLRVAYSYDELGNRSKKTDFVQLLTTFYITDASGNVMSTYEENINTGVYRQLESLVYGAERLGVYNVVNNAYLYELSDNLGNVRVVINRNKTADGKTDVVYYSDYYPFGSPLSLANSDYRYGYQGMFSEMDKETGWNNFKLRDYDANIGRWMKTDLYKEHWSPYMAMGNNPVKTTDPDGGCETCPNNGKIGDTFKSGNVTYTNLADGGWTREGGSLFTVTIKNNAWAYWGGTHNAAYSPYSPGGFYFNISGAASGFAFNGSLAVGVGIDNYGVAPYATFSGGLGANIGMPSASIGLGAGIIEKAENNTGIFDLHNALSGQSNSINLQSGPLTLTRSQTYKGPDINNRSYRYDRREGYIMRGITLGVGGPILAINSTVDLSFNTVFNIHKRN